jgi:O-antigen ligase
MYLMFAAYLALVIIRPHEYVPAFVGLDILPVALAATFVFWLFKPQKSFAAPQHVLVACFVAAAILSRGAMYWFGGALLAFEQLVPSLIFFVVCVTLAEEPRELERVLQVLCLSTLVLVAHGVDQILSGGVGWTGQGLDSRSGTGRIQYIGLFADPNDLGMLFVLCIPLCLYFGRKGGVIAKVFWWAGAAFLGYGVYLTNSRGALLSLIALITIWSALRIGKMTTGVAFALLVPMVVAATRLTGGIDTQEESIAGRLDAWYTALQLWEQRPLFGIGYGLFTDHNALTAHNSWLLVLAETGFVGYVFWFTATTLSLRMLWCMMSSPTSDGSTLRAQTPDCRLAAALFWSAAATLGAAFFLSRSYSLLFFLLWGWAAGHYLGMRRRGWALREFTLDSNAMRRWVGLAIFSVAIAYLIVKFSLVAL